MGLVISPSVRQKLTNKHGVSEDEIMQCFASREGSYLKDTRAEHKTDPPSQWFVAETDYGIKLKIVFIQKGSDIHIKTAYKANQKEIQIYNDHGK